MADRRIEWQIALDSAGVSKGAKGIDAELSAMRKAFDSLQNVKAFDAQLSALDDLASKLEAAKAKAAALAQEQTTAGDAAARALDKAELSVRKYTSELADAQKAAAELAAAAVQGGEDQQRAAESAAQKVNKLDLQLAAAKIRAADLAAAQQDVGARTSNAYAKAAAEVARLEQSLRSQTSAVAASAAALDKAGISTKDLAAETARVAEEYKAAAAAAGQAAKSQEAWAATGVRSTKELEAEIAKLQQLTKSGLLDERGIAAAEARIESLNKELGRTPPEAQSGVVSLASLTKGALGLAAAYLSIESAKQAIAVTAEFGDELQAVAAFSGATAAEMAKLRQNALDLAGAAGGPRAIAAGMADLATAGASASEILGTTGIVRDMAAASKGTLDFAAAGDLLTNVLKQYGLQITDAQPVADKLVKGWSSAGQSADQLGAGLLEVGAIYKDLYRNLGSTAAIEKSAAAISVLADVGFKGEKGGTALKNALAQLVAPAGAGEKVLAKYKDVIKIFDDTGNVRDFADIIDDIGRAGLSSRDKMVLFGREAGPAMAALVSVGGQAIRDMEAKLKSADGTAASVQKTMQDGLGGAIREATAEIEKAAIIFTDEFAPALRSALDTAKLATPALQLLTGEVKAIAAAANLGAAGVFSLLRPFEWLAEKMGLASKETNYWKDNASAAFASAKDLAGQSAAAYNAASGKVNELTEAQKRLDSASAKVSSRFGEISQATGVTVNSMAELDAAVAAGKIKWDDATSSWVGAEKQKQEAVAKTAVEATAAAEKAAEAEKEARKVAEKSWEEYGKKIKEIDLQIEEIGGFGGGSFSGLKKINGEWQYFQTNAEKAAGAMYGFNNASMLGLSQVADKIFELSLAGKDDLNVWESRRRAAEQYAAAASSLMAEGKQFAAAGDIDTATLKFEQAAAVVKKSEDAYKSLSTEVKNDFTPAMKKAHEEAKEGVKEYEKAAEKALSDAAKHYDKAKDAAGKLADRQLELEERLLKVRVAGQSSAEAYATMISQAQKYEAAARSAMDAGNFDEALAAADRAAGVWDSLGQEVKDGEQVIISSKQALAEQAAGIKSSGELAIQILTAQKEAEEAAGKAAEERSAKATAAKEAEAKKVAELEAEKEKVIISAEEGAQEAAAGTLSANQQLVEILEAQKQALSDSASQLDKAFGFSSAGEQIDKFIDEKLGGVSTATTAAAESVKTSMDASATSVAAASERITASVNAIPSTKEITVTERYVQAAAGGGLIHGFASGGSPAFRRLASPHITAGSGLRDDVPAMLMRNEYVLKASAVAAPALKGDGIALATAHNHGNWERMQAILTKHLGPPQIKLDMPAPRQQMQQLGVIKLHVGDVQAEVYATPDNAAAIHAAIAEAQRRAQRTAQAKKRAGVK